MRYGIALGSNLGDRLQNLREALSLLLQKIPGARLLAAAPVYETEPLDCPERAQLFYNTVIEVEADVTPLSLLDTLLAIEASMGRRRSGERNAPRTLDLDVLYAERQVLDDPRLTLPHPRMTQRRFVMEPLNQIRPDLVLPGETKGVKQLLEGLVTEEAHPRLIAETWV